MRVNKQTEYGVLALLQLAQKAASGGGLLSASHIGEGFDMPVELKRKVLQKLVRGGFIESKAGVGGGFSMSKNPEEITLLSVVKTFEPVELNKCERGCPHRIKCPAAQTWIGLEGDIELLMEKTTIASMLAKNT